VPALSAAHEHRAPLGVKVMLAQLERLPDAERTTPGNHDHRPQPEAVRVIACVAHHADDLLDGRWIGWVEHSPCCGERALRESLGASCICAHIVLCTQMHAQAHPPARRHARLLDTEADRRLGRRELTGGFHGTSQETSAYTTVVACASVRKELIEEGAVMVRASMLVLSSVAVLAVSVTGVEPAFAASPEFQVENKKTKKLEPLKKAIPFKESGGGWALVSSAEIQLRCAASSGKGKLTGPKSLTVQIKYTGCEEPKSKAACQSGKKPGEIKIAKLEGTLVSATKGGTGTLVPAIAYAPPSGGEGVVFSAHCQSTELTVSGTLLGEVTPLETSTTELTDTFAEGPEPEPACGKQEIQLVEGVGPCRHWRVVRGISSPTWVAAAKKKEFKGHVTLLK
jgi:hypothetical protein